MEQSQSHFKCRDAAAQPHPDVAEDDDDGHLSHFSRYTEFLSLLDRFLQIPGADQPRNPTSSECSNSKLLSQMRNILDEYQEQSYLIDPHLAAMVTPPVQALQQAVKSNRSLTTDNEELCDIARLLYTFTKVRGYKIILRFFPHEVGDVVPTVRALRTFSLLPDKTSGTWELRYILLLWLSLVCMIPFNLNHFSKTLADDIVDICQTFLESPGKERDAAAITLGKLFQRTDTIQSHLPAYISWTQKKLSPPAEPSPFVAIGVFQTFCEILKNPSPHFIEPYFETLQSLLSFGAQEGEEEDTKALEVLRSNGLVNRLRSKLATRMAVTLLRPRNTGRGVAQRSVGGANEGSSMMTSQCEYELVNDDDDVPPAIDAFIAQLLQGLQDKDSRVRYSSAKGLARLCNRLPAFFIDQVSDAIVGLFSVNVLILKDGSEDVSAVSEWTWQGACLGLAELGRRGLLNQEGLENILIWVKKCLFFDIRRGSHSIGSSVRDSAAYVLWALSRAYPSSALVPHALSLAQHLITGALLDREVAIRRAASAAFQECVGRWGLFPHGIAIVGKTDFFSVGIRRVAFLEALPFVASHEEYRDCLIDALLQRTIVHWELGMRELGAKAVAKVVQLDCGTLAPGILKRLEPSCRSRDSVVLHGTLLTLAHIGRVCKLYDGASEETQQALDATQKKAFELLKVIPTNTFRSLGGALILEAACALIAATATEDNLRDLHQGEKGIPTTYDAFIDAALARREESCHEAAASALAVVSRTIDCQARIERVVNSPKNWKAMTVSQQQSFALILGSIHFHERSLVREEKTISLLHSCVLFLYSLVTVKPGNTLYSGHIETRRNALNSLVAILQQQGNALPDRIVPDLARSVLQALVDALNDYTTDQRGDVGSWVRVAAMRGLVQLVSLYRGVYNARGSNKDVETRLPDELFHAIVAGIGKQMMERIDNVRIEAVEHFLSLYPLKQGQSQDLAGFPQPYGREIVISSLLPDSTSTTANSRMPPETLRTPSLLFPRLVKLLLIPQYRVRLLTGILQTLYSRTDLAVRIVGPSLVGFALADHEGYSCQAVWRDLLELSEGRDAKLVGGGMLAMNLLLEGGLVDTLLEEEGEELKKDHGDSTVPWSSLFHRSLIASTRNLSKIKTHQRLLISLNLGVNLLSLPMKGVQQGVAKEVVGFFLRHTNASIRRAAAEKLYVVLTASEALQEAEEGGGSGSRLEAEQLLLDVPWGEDREFEAEATEVTERLLALIQRPDIGGRAVV